MLRLLFRLVVLAVVVGIVALFYFTYSGSDTGSGAEGTVGTTGLPVHVDSAKRAGEEAKERFVQGAELAEKALSEAALTTKIRSKMALDDTIDASQINVDTSGTVVIVTGTVTTKAQRERILQLARETAGVTSVVDRVQVKAQK